MRAAILAALVTLIAGAAGAREACPAGLHPVTTAELFFGADVPGGGRISDQDWAKFQEEEITPRFPEGLTTWDADGRWRTPAGVETHEKSRVLLLILTDRRGARAKLDALMSAYKARYHQLSVGLVEHRDCAAF